MPVFWLDNFVNRPDFWAPCKARTECISYWFNEVRSTAFCLVDAPSKEFVQIAHIEAHGGVLHEIIEVDPTVVQAFPGRVKDPAPAGNETKNRFCISRKRKR